VKRLVVATTNAGKAREVQLALAEPGDWGEWTVEPIAPGIPAINETGATFIENAIQKAEYYSRSTEALTLADDSGLCVHALHNAPGVHTARYAATAEALNARVIAELDACGTADRSATFVCAFAAARGGVVDWTVETSLCGEIVLEPRGEFGFGYDPIFYVPELGKTLAELTPAEKNTISARGRALSAFRQFLQTFSAAGRL
jgi:XTP/dITP diphosphohydrolase